MTSRQIAEAEAFLRGACNKAGWSSEPLSALLAELEHLTTLVRRGPGRFCDVCFTSSFSPCDGATANAIPDVIRPGGFMVCDYCELVAAHVKAVNEAERLRLIFYPPAKPPPAQEPKAGYAAPDEDEHPAHDLHYHEGPGTAA